MAAMLAIYGALNLPAPPPEVGDHGSSSDAAIYRSLTDNVVAGKDYYGSAIELHRANDYPLKPFVTVRLPTLTWFLAALPSHKIRHVVLHLLVIAAAISFFMSAWLEDNTPPLRSLALVLLLLSGLGVATTEPGVYFHEIWAAVFMTFSIAARRHLFISVAFGLIAVLIRELALPLLVAMGLLHAIHGRWKAATVWSSAIGIFIVAMAFHAHAVAQFVRIPMCFPGLGWHARLAIYPSIGSPQHRSHHAWPVGRSNTYPIRIGGSACMAVRTRRSVRDARGHVCRIFPNVWAHGYLVLGYSLVAIHSAWDCRHL